MHADMSLQYDLIVKYLSLFIQKIYNMKLLSLTQGKWLVFFEETSNRTEELLPWDHYHGYSNTGYDHDKNYHLWSLRDAALY